jgi:acyl-CoA synthetase (AMP-forming)/AMP-acid ligase II
MLMNNFQRRSSMSQSFAAGQAYAYPLIIKKLLNTPLIYAPDQQIIYRDRLRHSYRELDVRIRKLAHVLTQLGIRSGDTVAVFDFDSHRYLECFFAIPMLGAVLQTVNWRLSAAQIAYTLNHAGAKLVLINAGFFPQLEAIRPDLKTVETYAWIREGEAQPKNPAGFAGEYEDLLAAAPADFVFADLDENTKATTFYTTGTTGDPKGVYFTHRQLVLHTLGVGIALGGFETIGRFRSNDVYMPLTPMFHVHAWGLPYVASLLGVKQVYPGKYEPEMLLKLIADEKVTFSHCVPTILQMIVTSPAARRFDLSNWKVIIGGAPLSKGLARAAGELGITVFTGYGMSETCPIISLATPKAHMLPLSQDQHLDIITKTGMPVPLVEFEVVDADDQPLPHDGRQTGEVVMRAPWLTQGYYKAPEKTAQLWRNGYLHSGDVGHIDAQGYLQITDRIKDVIKSGGEWISSLDLENILSQHEAVLESAAIGVPDSKWGERPVMLVVLRPEYKGKVDAGQLQAHMQQAAEQGRLPKYGVPRRLELIESLPKTSVGKLDKKLMRQEYQRQS